MSDLRAQLQAAVGDTYRIEEELGGGGMSRVFLAEEVALDRKVVIKVLPPEMAAEVSKDRFKREIQLAAKLQHPHVVSLLTAGSTDDLLYYVMPYIEGESLRSKLHREGELPVGEAVKILQEVVDALAYAHKHGVVHRDIKPDNVMLSERHALVTDFGVAKAVTTSGTGTSVTSVGIALGTPAYMAPEQAAADPHTDHRADIYAVGTLAYEMLTGEPPFTGSTPQAVMGKHMTEVPQPVSKRRPAVTEVLQSLVMRCLEKRPADRWQTAEELLPQLEALSTPSGGVTPTGTQPIGATSAETMLRKSAPARVAALFGLTMVAVLAVTYVLVMQLGLPYWVLSSAAMLLVVCLPVVMLTGRAERRRASARLTGVMADDAGTKSGRWFTWRKTLFGSGVAVAGLAVVTVVYMAMRMLGIGPAATLLSAGVLESQERLIVADFEDRAGDSTLADVVTGLVRDDLFQSPAIRILEADSLNAVLRRMQLPHGTRVTVEIARDLAEREGIKAIVTGDVSALGGSYLISARLLNASSGETLVSLRETAEDGTGIINAVNRLTRNFRERIGESLRSVRASPPLRRVTTASLPALRKFTQAARAFRGTMEVRSAIRLYREAIELDSLFGSAYLALATQLSNLRTGRRERMELLETAFRLRHHFAEPTRRWVEISYYGPSGTHQPERLLRTLLEYMEELPPEDKPFGSVAIAYRTLRDDDEYLRYANLALARDSASGINHWHVCNALVRLGRLEEAREAVQRADRLVPGHPTMLWGSIGTELFLGDLEAVESRVGALTATANPMIELLGRQVGLKVVARYRGQLDEANRVGTMDWGRARREIPPQFRPIFISNRLAGADAKSLLENRPEQAIAFVEDLLETFPMDSTDVFDRPYVPLAGTYAIAGDPETARELLREFESLVPEEFRRDREPDRLLVRGHIAMAEGRPADAIAEYRAADFGECLTCALPWLARAYDAAGNADSALAVFERYFNTFGVERAFNDALHKAPTHKRLGELYEARGDSDKAVEHYNEFVEMWWDADPMLQPQVQDARERIARLVGETAR